jgi:hypothetical protein
VVIRDFIAEHIGNEAECAEFIEVLLDKFWVVEVSLKTVEAGSELFGPINDRGLGLGFADIARYECLSHQACVSNISLRRNIAEKWGEVFRLYQLIFGWSKQSLDDLLDRFVRARWGYTDKEMSWAVVARFWSIDNRPQSQAQLEGFVGELLEVLVGFCNVLMPQANVGSSSVDEWEIDNIASVSGLQGQEERMVELCYVLGDAMKVSKNSRYLVMSELVDWTGRKATLFSRLEGVLKDVVLTEFSEAKKSNVTRTEYLGSIQVVNGFVSKRSLLCSGAISKLKVSKRLAWVTNADAKFLIQYGAGFMEKGLVWNFRQVMQRRGFDVDHFIPREWETYWLQIHSAGSKHSLINTVVQLGSTSRYACLDLRFIQDMNDQADDVIGLVRAGGGAVKRSKSRVFDWLGNRWLLDKGSNRYVSNKGFADKKSTYLNPGQFRFFPASLTPLGMKYVDQGSFGPKEILERTLELNRALCKALNGDWFD